MAIDCDKNIMPENDAKTENKAAPRRYEVPIWKKATLSIPEAAAYSGIGEHKLRELIEEEDCSFVLITGPGKKRIKREKFEKFLSNAITL